MRIEVLDRRTAGRLLAVVSAIVLLRLTLQAMLPSDVGGPAQPSAIVQAGLVVPAVALLFLLAYMLMGATFVILRDRLPGAGASKGLWFGLAFALMWGAYLLEPVELSVGNYAETVGTAAVDVVPIVLLGVLLGAILSKGAPGHGKGHGGIPVLYLAAIPAAFSLARLIEFGVLGVYSVFSTMPTASMLWAAGTGTCLAIMYALLREALPAGSAMKRAGLFGIGVLALNLLVFNMFMPLLIEFSAWGVGGLSYVDLFVRTAIDVIAVVVGVLVFERLSSMKISREVSERTPADW